MDLYFFLDIFFFKKDFKLSVLNFYGPHAVYFLIMRIYLKKARHISYYVHFYQRLLQEWTIFNKISVHLPSANAKLWINI